MCESVTLVTEKIKNSLSCARTRTREVDGFEYFHNFKSFSLCS